jgi:hypothetical protein
MRQIVHRLVRTLVNNLVLAGGAVLIVGTILSPVTFQFQRLTWSQYVAGFNLAACSLLEFPLNVLLFAPFWRSTTVKFRRQRQQ